MKVICSKTSIEFRASGFTTLSVTSSEHPLFSTPFSTLREIVASSWRKRELSEGESRVLFVALFASTKKIVWRCPATPSAEIVEKYMDYMLFTANWKDAIGDRLELPSFHITHDTREMKDVGTWLSVWNSKQKEEVSASYTLRVREDIAKAQKKLKELLTAGREGDALFTKHLFNWFIVAANVPKGVVAFWEQLFFMDNYQLWAPVGEEKQQLLRDLEEMQLHCEESFFSSSSSFVHDPTSWSVLCYRRIAYQIKECREGVLGALGEGSAPYTIISSPSSPSSAQVEGAGPGTSSYLTSLSEPLMNQFSSSVEYIRARARWKLSKMKAQEAQELSSERSEHSPTTVDKLNEVTGVTNDGN